MKTVEEVRRERLRELLKEVGGSLVSLNKRTDKNDRDSTYSQILNQSVGSRTGKPKEMGSALARSLETHFGKPVGWMDTPINAESTDWPFTSVRPTQIAALSHDSRLKLEGGMALLLAQLGISLDASPSAPAPAPAAAIPRPDLQQASRRDIAAGIVRTASAAANDPEYVAIRTVSMRISAGVTGFSVDPEEDDGTGGLVYVSRAWMVKRGYRAEALFAVRAKGWSMWPRVHPDDITLVNTDDTKKVSKQVYAFNHEGEFTLKRLLWEHNRWFLQSDNPDQAKYPQVLASELTFPIGRAVLLHAEDL